MNIKANRTCIRHVSTIGLVRALLALFIFGFMTTQGMTISLVAGAESIQSPNQMAAVMRTVLNWLECEECIDGELTAVLQWHSIAVPPLSVALRDGPSPSSRQTYTNELNAHYARMANYHGSNPNNQLTLTLDEYRALHLENYVRLYRIRALTALSMIGGTTATAALEDALHAPFPEEIEIRVREALTRRESRNPGMQ